jgi:hypothetical protein
MGDNQPRGNVEGELRKHQLDMILILSSYV